MTSPLSPLPDEPRCNNERSYGQHNSGNQEGNVERRCGYVLWGWYTWRCVRTSNDEARPPTNGDRFDDTPSRNIEHDYIASAERYEAQLPVVGDGDRLR